MGLELASLRSEEPVLPPSGVQSLASQGGRVSSWVDKWEEIRAVGVGLRGCPQGGCGGPDQGSIDTEDTSPQSDEALE